MADRHQTLPRVRWSPGFTTVRQKFGVFSPPKNGRPKTSKLRRDFGQLRDLIATLEYLQTATRYRQPDVKLSYRRETARQLVSG